LIVNIATTLSARLRHIFITLFSQMYFSAFQPLPASYCFRQLRHSKSVFSPQLTLMPLKTLLRHFHITFDTPLAAIAG
jgi:hypothetical protein